MLRFLDALLWRCPPRPKLLPWWGRRRGRFVQRVRLGRKIVRATAQDVTLLLGTIDLSHIAAMRGTTPEQCAETLKAALGLTDAGLAAAVGGSTYKLDIAITEMRPLAWWLDLWVDVGHVGFNASILGILGFGHAWLQVEGALWESGASRPALEFAHRARWPIPADMRWGRLDLAMSAILGRIPPHDVDPLRVLCVKAAHAILQEAHATVAK